MSYEICYCPCCRTIQNIEQTTMCGEERHCKECGAKIDQRRNLDARLVTADKDKIPADDPYWKM